MCATNNAWIFHASSGKLKVQQPTAKRNSKKMVLQHVTLCNCAQRLLNNKNLAASSKQLNAVLQWHALLWWLHHQSAAGELGKVGVSGPLTSSLQMGQLLRPLRTQPLRQPRWNLWAPGHADSMTRPPPQSFT